MPTSDKIIAGFFALLVIAFALFTVFLMMIGMIPQLLAFFTLITCALALWVIVFYVWAETRRD